MTQNGSVVPTGVSPDCSSPVRIVAAIWAHLDPLTPSGHRRFTSGHMGAAGASRGGGRPYGRGRDVPGVPRRALFEVWIDLNDF